MYRPVVDPRRTIMGGLRTHMHAHGTRLGGYPLRQDKAHRRGQECKSKFEFHRLLPLCLSDAPPIAADSDFAEHLADQQRAPLHGSRRLWPPYLEPGHLQQPREAQPTYPAPSPETHTDPPTAPPVLRVACRHHARPASPRESAPAAHPSPDLPASPPQT